MRLQSALVGLLLLSGSLSLQAQSIITTVAGTDVLFPGEGQPGPGIPLGRNTHVTVDLQGRPVFSDSYYNVIVRVENDGTLHVVAGNNVQGLGGTTGFGSSGGGFSGDNGPATSAALNRPRGVIYDSQGNLYIADSYNDRIRMVNPGGIISTLAGSGKVGFQDGPAATALFNIPLDLAVDSSGAVIVNDAGNRRIRRISQGRVTTIAGGGQAAPADNAVATSVALGTIIGLTADSQGSIYFSDFGGNKVYKITPAGLLLTVAGTGSATGSLGEGGPALRASLFSPGGLAIDSSGAIYVTVTNNELIRKILNGTITTIAGSGKQGFAGDNGPALSAAFNAPYGLGVSAAGNVYVADSDNFRIRRVDASKNISTTAGNGGLLFSADGKQAIFAPLLDPFGVTTDNGGLLVADTHNNLVRSIDAAGTFSTIAGNGNQEEGADNLPATQSGLFSPVRVNRDLAGNLLIADLDGGNVREVLPTNIIKNFAAPPAVTSPSQAVTDSNGNIYVADFVAGAIKVFRSGQSSILKSNLKGPLGLAVDNLNNLYYTEYAAGTVSMVPTIPGVAAATVTIASGLVHPAGIAVDSARNVYVTDAGDHRVRKLTPAGSTWTISTIAGNGQSGYSGDGGIATNASLRNPFGVSVDSKGTIYVADTSNNRIRAIQTVPPALSVSTSSLAFTVNQGGALSDPATFDVTASSFGHLAGLLFTASTSQPWISVSPALGSTPATLRVTVDPSSLIAKTYNETVSITAPGANPPVQTLSIVVTVNAPPPPDLSVDTTVINAGLNAGGQPLTRQIQVVNRGGQQSQVTAAATMQSGAGWLSILPGTGVAAANAPAVFTANITPGNLPPGAYTGQIILTSGGKQVGVVPVNVVVNAKLGKLLLSSNALNFTAIKGGGAPLAKGIDIVNTGTGSLPWKSSGASLTANTPNWLSLDTAGGTLETPQASIATVNASVKPGALGIGTYYGQIQVTSDSAANSPQFVTVVLNVVDAATNPGPDVSATALVFTGVQGVNPSSQTIQISNLGSQSLSYGSTRVSEDGDWIVHVPTDASLAAGQTSKIVVQPDFTSLAAGTHRGAITLRFNDTSVRSIDVLSIVAPGTSTLGIGLAPSSRALSSRAVSPCASDPSHAFVVEVMSPVQSYAILANQAAPIQATVRDCSGNAAPNSSTVLAYFNVSSGLPTLTMRNASGAMWTADWTPATPAKNITLAIGATFAAAGGRAQSGTSLDITGNITARSNAPTANALANAASFVAQSPVAPGAFVTIFGTNLANTTASATAVPLKSSLAGATVTLAGRPLPILYASDTQINAQVPYDLPMFSQQQLSVQRDDSLSPQLDFVVGRAQPAIYTATARGTGQGVIVFANTVTYVDASQPAKAGDLLTIYCNGLGPVQGNVDAGTPVTVATSTIDPATVTIGGVNAPVLYAGLTPGIPGLYQINVQTPTGVTPGNAVPVAITISGQTSPDGVTIAVR